MEQTLIQQLWGGIQVLLASINWVFVPVFIVIMWLLNEGADSTTNFKWLNWLQKIPKGWRVFIGGILLAIPFAWVYNLTSKTEIASLLYSVLVGMIAWKLGIENIFQWFKDKVWHNGKPTV